MSKFSMFSGRYGSMNTLRQNCIQTEGRFFVVPRARRANADVNNRNCSNSFPIVIQQYEAHRGNQQKFR